MCFSSLSAMSSPLRPDSIGMRRSAFGYENPVDKALDTFVHRLKTGQVKQVCAP